MSSSSYGELSNKSFIFREVVWKIPDFFSLPKAGQFFVESPSFSFANATWCLKIYPNGGAFRLETNADVYIRRLRSLVPEHTVFFQMFIQPRNGTEFKSRIYCVDFTQKNSIRGVVKFLYSRLQAERDSISSNGPVTVMCEMRIQKMSVSEAHSQTELYEALGSNENKVELPKDVHMNNLSQDLQGLLLCEEHSDVTIQVKGQNFRAHRNILGARSSVFASMFRNDMKEKATGIVDVEDCDPDTFPDFLHYLYSGSVEKVNVDNVFSLYTAADKYNMQNLKSECLEFIMNNLSLDTFCDAIRLSLQHSETRLLKLATNFFAKNMLKIVVTVKWQAFIVENPIQANEILIKSLSSDETNSA